MHLASDTYSWNISDIDINLLVPGDFIVKANDHVVYVLNVNFPENSRDLGIEYHNRIDIIHSTSSENKWRVRNDQKWLSLPTAATYERRRLIIK